ncbi:MAG: hypothetical protein C0403_04975, partial [Desulfobacterium sp.]|nr:hypothetical protein [Desulfobacterium sp.]
AASDTTFAGDYAFTGIPTTVHGSLTYRITVTMDGYQRFEGYITPDATDPDDDTDTLGGNNNTIDTVYNMIGNVYLFPLGETAADVNVYVEYNNERISGATVYLEQDTANNAETAEESIAANQLVASTGQLVNLSATTGADGRAIFSGSNLVLGGRYRITVLPIVYEGVQLALNDEAVAAFIVGTTVNTQVVNMADTAPGTEDNGLYIVYASNNDDEDIVSTGVLTLVFSKPVGIVSEDAFTAILNNESTAVLDVTDGVTAAMSADGLTMTLTPIFSTAIVPYNPSNPAGPPADINMSITYTGGQVYLLGDNRAEALTILIGGADGVQYLDGNDVGRDVQMTPPVTN